MSKEKQIEEMAKDICRHYEDEGVCKANLEFDKCDCECWTGTYLAPTLYEAGYRKQSEVIRCKDCEYFREYTDEYKRDFKYKTERADGDCHIRLINTYLGNSQYCACKYDDFCSFAKAKGGAE